VKIKYEQINTYQEKLPPTLLWGEDRLILQMNGNFKNKKEFIVEYKD